MAKLERIKVEARKEELNEQRENAAEITQKVEAISTPQAKMEDSDKLAREALEKLRVAKKSVDVLRKDFEQIISDISVKNFLEKRGITTLEEYVSSDQGKDTDLANKYQEVAKQASNSSEDLKSKVKTRAANKKELFKELNKDKKETETNQPTEQEIAEQEKRDKFKTRPFSQLQKEASEKIREIPEKEIETLVDSLVDKKREAIRDTLSKAFNTTLYYNVELISESDIIDLQKYGNRYYHTAEKMFKDKIIKLTTEMAKTIGSEAYNSPTLDKSSLPTKDVYIKNRLSSIIERIDVNLRESKGKVESSQRIVDNVISTEEMTAKLEAIKPEIEAIFSEVIKNIRSNSFYSWIERFWASDGNYNGKTYDHKMRVIFKKFDLRQNPLSKYFSSTESFVKDMETPVHSLKFDQLTKNISILEQDEESTKVELSQQQTRLSTFSGKNFFTRLANKAEGENINTELRKIKEKIQNLAEIKKLLVALAEFTNKIDIVMKNESIGSLPFQNVDSSPEAYSASFIKVIDDYKKQLNQYI